MNENTDEALIDLLIKKATYGLTDAEQVQLDRLENGRHDHTFDLTVSAIALIDERGEEPMPSHLRANIRASAERYFDESEEAARSQSVPKVVETGARPSILNWLGWAIAAAACIALAANLYTTRIQPGPQVVTGPTPTPAEKLTPAQMRQRLMESQGDMDKASWSKGNMKDMPEVTGDIVWSDSMQEGYMRLRGLPMNDNSKQQYQLWIFDETQSDKTPIDGGVFDVNENGELIIPVKAALKARKPKMFAITVERPGGVMVSDRSKIAALGKVET